MKRYFVIDECPCKDVVLVKVVEQKPKRTFVTLKRREPKVDQVIVVDRVTVLL